MAYSEAAFSRHVLKLKPDDICFSVQKVYFAYGFGNTITFPFSVGTATLLLPGQKLAAIFTRSRVSSHLIFGLPTLYTSLDKGRRRGGHDFLAAHGAVRGRSASARL